MRRVIFVSPEKAEDLERLLRHWEDPEVEEIRHDLYLEEYFEDQSQIDLFKDQEPEVV